MSKNRVSAVCSLGLAAVHLMWSSANSEERYENVGAAAVILGYLITRPGPVTVVTDEMATVPDLQGDVWEIRRNQDQICKFGLLGGDRTLVGEVDFSRLTGQYQVRPQGGRYMTLTFSGSGDSAGYCFRASATDYRCFNDLILGTITEGQARSMLTAAEFIFSNGCRAPLRPY